MKTNSIRTDLTTGNVTTLLARFAGPFVLANLLQVCYGLTDMVIVGNFVESAGISAVSISSNVLNMLTLVGVGLSSAGQVYISQSLGSDNSEKVPAMIGTMFSFLSIIAVILTVVGCTMTSTILGWLNTPAEAFGYAQDYLITCFCGLFFIYGYNMISSILRSMGDSKRPLMFVAISAGTNVVLDLVFVGLFDMKTTGAALATVAGQGLSFIISLIYLYRRKEEFGFDFKPRSFKIHKASLVALLKLGIPMVLQHASICFSMLFVSSYINAYGVVASAVTGVGNKISQVAIIVTNGFGQAGSSIVGQCFGAGKHDRVNKTVVSCLGVGLVFSIILSTTIALFPEQVFAIFDDSKAVLEMSHDYVIIAVINIMGSAVRAPFNAFINGIGFARMNFIMGITDGVIMRIGLAMLLGIVFNMGIMGFWLGNALAGLTHGVVVGPYFISGIWKKRKLIVTS